MKAKAALSHTSKLAPHASSLNSTLAHALSAWFPGENIPKNVDSLDHTYVDTMQQVYQLHETDVNIVALITEALICTCACVLWDLDTGKPASNYTHEACTVLESVMALESEHQPCVICIYT